MLVQNNKFPKAEKLKSKKDIDFLFSEGAKVKAYPLMGVYGFKSESTGVVANVGIAVPKKYVRKAVDRNLVKRRVREAYRLNNHELKNTLEGKGKEINLMLIYTTPQILPYNQIEEKIKVILKRLNTEVEKVTG